MMISYFISVVAAIAFTYFVISNFGKLDISARTMLIGGVSLGAWPAYFSPKACATQFFLIQPGGGRATMRLLVVNIVGGLWGGIIIEAVLLVGGLTYATVLVAGFYLLAAWIFTQGRSFPFAGIALTPTG